MIFLNPTFRRRRRRRRIRRRRRRRPGGQRRGRPHHPHRLHPRRQVPAVGAGPGRAPGAGPGRAQLRAARHRPGQGDHRAVAGHPPRRGRPPPPPPPNPLLKTPFVREVLTPSC